MITFVAKYHVPEDPMHGSEDPIHGSDDHIHGSADDKSE